MVAVITAVVVSKLSSATSPATAIGYGRTNARSALVRVREREVPIESVHARAQSGESESLFPTIKKEEEAQEEQRSSIRRSSSIRLSYLQAHQLPYCQAHQLPQCLQDNHLHLHPLLLGGKATTLVN